MTLLEFLRRERLTFEQFGAQIGRDRTQVWRWAMGKRTPDLETAMAIERETGGEVQAESFLPPTCEVAPPGEAAA
jgi:transcriptional regulator with XRE-family HTH domain